VPNKVTKKGSKASPKPGKLAKKKATHAPAKRANAERTSFKGVTKSLRAYLSGATHTISEMIAGLDVTEDAVLFGLRRLGKSKKGTLRSGMVEGRPCWWWEGAPPRAAIGDR